MAAILLEPPTVRHAPTTMPDKDDHEARDMSCPACGSSATYQVMSGRWGCTNCGATWSG
ncbi:eL43 family ribosomal protein [Streptacidiphilus fuscans]|uniref:Transposase zinc-ribbon domain-containing protein n=1 Tax=Streptacidiphilus fuscans TaxID=2789292 RepID=A0A931BB89_9ACTN|nr:hypothetical protein [Streptacidiphilus fuscans]MBF9072057.1 hypothetical protein [Streptacidiphilus fuscans]